MKIYRYQIRKLINVKSIKRLSIGLTKAFPSIYIVFTGKVLDGPSRFAKSTCKLQIFSRPKV